MIRISKLRIITSIATLPAVGREALRAAWSDLLIGAASEGPGDHRFDRAASRHPVDIKAFVRSQIDKALQTSRLFTVVKANADTTLRLEIFAYGIAPINGREHGGVISAETELISRDGKGLWKKIESGVSHTTAPLESYEADADLWARVAEEAASDLARKLILYSDTSERTAGPFAY